MFQLFLILNQKIEQNEVFLTLDYIKNELIKNMNVYKSLLNSHKLEDFFNEFHLRVKRSNDKILNNDNGNINKFQSSLYKTQAEKNFSDIAHSIDINMERLINSLYKGNRKRNYSNKIISSKSLNDNTNKDNSFKSIDKTNVGLDNHNKEKNNFNFSTIKLSNSNDNNIADIVQQESNIEFNSMNVNENGEDKEKYSKKIETNKELSIQIELKKENEDNSSSINNINNEIMNNDSIFEGLNLTATAIFDFVPSQPEELGFNKGDVLEIEMLEGKWWKGKINGKTGLIPYNYVRIN